MRTMIADGAIVLEVRAMEGVFKAWIRVEVEP